MNGAMTHATPEVQLRKAHAADLSVLLEMMEPFNASEGVVWSATASRPAVARLIDDPSLGAIGLFEARGQVVGYFVVTWGYDLEWVGRDAFLTEIYLAPPARGRGLGSRALSLVEDLARAEGSNALHLMVRPENAPAVRLYAKAGYTEPPRTFLTKDLRRRPAT
jgi:ribosomal protein S18 acetylase RimI-like enzyme